MWIDLLSVLSSVSNIILLGLAIWGINSWKWIQNELRREKICNEYRDLLKELYFNSLMFWDQPESKKYNKDDKGKLAQSLLRCKEFYELNRKNIDSNKHQNKKEFVGLSQIGRTMYEGSVELISIKSSLFFRSQLEAAPFEQSVELDNTMEKITNANLELKRWVFYYS